MKNMIATCLVLFLIGCQTNQEIAKLEPKEELLDMELDSRVIVIEKELAESKLLIEEQIKQLKELEKIIEKLGEELEQKADQISKLMMESDKIDIVNYGQLHIYEPELIINLQRVKYDEMTIEKVHEFWGQPMKSDEWENPHGGGTVKYLNYGFVELYFNIQNDNEALRSFTTSKNDYVTYRGIKVGDSKENMIKAYGDSYEYYKEDETVFIFYGWRTGIEFKLSDNKIVEITLRYVYE